MFRRVKGTTDFFPEDHALLKHVLSTYCSVAKKYGFQHVTSPALETLKCLTAKSGKEITEQIFLLEKRGAEELGLRFDLTIPMTRMFVSRQRELPKPVKWYTADRMWRYESPQQGREREFFQLSVESFGSDKPESDAELINMAQDCLLALGLKEKDFIIKVNHRKLLEGILQELIPKNKLEGVIQVVDKTERITQAQFVAELKKAGVGEATAKKIHKTVSVKDKPSNAFKKIEAFKLNSLAKQGLEELKKILALVKHPNVLVDLSTARGLAYYTGFVFEAYDAKESIRSLLGGGRYDNLVEMLGGQPCPATGFAIGYSTVKVFLEQKKLVPKPVLGPDFFVAVVNEDVLADALEVCHELRQKFVVDIDLMRRKLGKQFDHANTLGAKNVIVVGPEELKKGVFTIKNMRTGKESKKSVKELLS